MRKSKHNMNRQEYRASGSRLYAVRGADLPQAKLDDKTVARIRRLHARKKRLIDLLNRKYSAAGLAASLGVHVRTVEKVLRRDSWCHVRENTTKGDIA